MKFKEIGDKYLIRLFKNEKILETLQSFCMEKTVKSGFINALGAVSFATLGYYNLSKKKYLWRDFGGDFEVTSLIGNIAILEDKVFIHAHVNLSNRNFGVFGGHLKEAIVGATLEVMLIPGEGAVIREFDDEIGLNLLDLN